MGTLRLPTMDFAADLAGSIEVIRANAPADGRPYYGLFSGGKDSVALREVARMAGVNVEWYYNVTTIDPPELVRFIRREHPDVRWLRPKHGPFFVRAAEVKGFPTRVGKFSRWCCDEYKERKVPADSVLLMGIRSQESPKRAAAWGLVSQHKRTRSTTVNPLLHWDSEDLWDFIRGHGLTYSELYDEGFHRLGCIGCPMSSERARRHEFARWPSRERMWRKVLWRTWDRRTGTLQRDGRPWFGNAYFKDWHEMWEWWLCDRPLPSRR